MYILNPDQKIIGEQQRMIQEDKQTIIDQKAAYLKLLDTTAKHSSKCDELDELQQKLDELNHTHECHDEWYEIMLEQEKKDAASWKKQA